MSDESLEGVYGRRFSDVDAASKESMWRPIARFVQQWVDASQPLLDIGCDRGHFIRHVRASERWATDVRDVSAHLPAGVKFVQALGTEIDRHLAAGYFGTVWMSNYLEHLDDGRTVLRQLEAAFSVTRPGGRLIVLQPNIRLTGGKYWDFIDHKTPLTDRSLIEAAELAGFQTRRVIVRFLPFTTKSRLPQSPWLVDAYLRFPPAWRFLGEQTLYIGSRPSGR